VCFGTSISYGSHNRVWCLLPLPAVAFALLQKSVFVRRYNYYSLVTVGFSGVVFGLKVGAAARAAADMHSVAGLSPGKATMLGNDLAHAAVVVAS
jgi:hypothetical protein